MAQMKRIGWALNYLGANLRNSHMPEAELKGSWLYGLGFLPDHPATVLNGVHIKGYISGGPPPCNSGIMEI